MVQLHVLSGKKAGYFSKVRRFPFSIGRAAENDLQLSDPGVWERHATLNLEQTEAVTLTAAPQALVAVNHQPVQSARLCNGDVITCGSVNIQFELAPVRQRGLRFHEVLAWVLIAAVTISQFALIYWLLEAPQTGAG
ncbi:MAG TPA: FHA domain-containing protein [Verrucomicrobiae bacterium]|nr:FHA domain-containing protein [Verrucomicrobiae bacterium]